MVIEKKEQGSFTYWTEQYFGSDTKITTVSWRGKGEVDSNEVREWCIATYGPSGYREEENTSYWVDNTDKGEVMLCRDDFVTLFLLKWV